MKPLFIFSLPRSGSTLLQRILAVSDQISTSAEPWVLLPHLYSLKDKGVAANYWHSSASHAIEDFYNGFPNGRRDYLDALREFILRLYEKRSRPEHIYFLDKTPRYHLICEDIIELFPDAGFILLWRNPLAIVASIIRSWCKGNWKYDVYNVDIFDGIKNLVTAYTRTPSKFHTIRYESIIRNPSAEIHQLCHHLEIAYDEQMITSFNNVQFSGQMGDKVGTKRYHSLNDSSLDVWKKTFNNPYRRRWAKRYLKWIGKENLKIMGYDILQLESAVDGIKGFNVYTLLLDGILTLLMKKKLFLSPLGVHQGNPIKYLYQ